VECNEFGTQLGFLIGDELDADAQAALLAHSEQCSNCSAQLTIGRSLRSGMSEHLRAATPRCPDALRLGVRRGFRRQRIQRFTGASLGGVAVAAAVFAVAFSEPKDPLENLVARTLDYRSRDLPQDLAFEPKERVQRFLAQQVGRPVALPQRGTHTVQGVRYMPTAGRRGAMITLRHADERIDLLAVEADSKTSGHLNVPRLHRRNGNEVLQFQRGGVIYNATTASGRAPTSLFQFAGYRR
jgi:hypothetical protein